ncbi:MAG: hypothetical protein ABI707_07435 [Ferruginibacter sp.]
MNRKNFLHIVASGTTGFLLLNNMADGQATPARQDIPPYPLEMVKEFVIAGHKDLPRVQTMIVENPNLVHCKYDWGNGDFEEAIEGAGHMGNREIAQFLIDAGSRVTLFVLTMLGKTELVKPVLETYPKLVFANGPHGFTLLHHAKQGGKEAADLYDYLQEKGLKDTWVKIK